MEDYKYKLSIIVPMYNAEKYIGTCLDSILDSDLSKADYEIVVVNDGSTDKGHEIISEYLKENSNISYYEQENQGQSSARNIGINNCNGEYIWCVDSDDKVCNNLNVILEKLSKHDVLDIFAVQLKQVTENNDFVKTECLQPELPHNTIMSGRDAIIYGYNPSSVCALVVRRQLIINYGLFFHIGITHQDVELSYRLFTHAKQVYFSDIQAYFYIIHPNSTSQSVNPQKKIKYLSDEIILIESFLKLANEFEKLDLCLTNTIRQRVRNMHLGMTLNLLRHRNEWKYNGINKSVLANMRKAGLFPLSGDFGNLKKNIVSKILNIEKLYC